MRCWSKRYYRDKKKGSSIGCRVVAGIVFYLFFFCSCVAVVELEGFYSLLHHICSHQVMRESCFFFTNTHKVELIQVDTELTQVCTNN